MTNNATTESNGSAHDQLDGLIADMSAALDTNLRHPAAPSAAVNSGAAKVAKVAEKLALTAQGAQQVLHQLHALRDDALQAHDQLSQLISSMEG